MEITIGVIFLGIVIIFIVSIAWTDRVGAPWVPTPFNTVHHMLKLAEVGPHDTVYDLGCGDGRTVIIAARRYGAKAVGIEIDPFRYMWCQMLIAVLGLRKQVSIRYGNFFNHDLSEATVVTCYLLQDTNNQLLQKLRRELVAGTRVVSNTFVFPGLENVRQEINVKVYLI